MDKVVLFSGSSAVGKTAVLRWAAPTLAHRGCPPALCKIDCISDEDRHVFAGLGLPAVSGISGDVCPDHFLVSNLADLWEWSRDQNASCLLIETAGLCHRCSPATRNMLAGCVVDATASCKAPEHLGPMLTQADFVVVSKTDMVSQAEREIVCANIARINPHAAVFAIDGLAGYGVDELCDWIMEQAPPPTLEGDTLRHTMPSGVCSYCVGERRVGSAFQQGVVGKMTFEDQPAAPGKSASRQKAPLTAYQKGGSPCMR